MHEIDVEQIIADVRADIEKAGYTEKDLGWDSIHPSLGTRTVGATVSFDKSELDECVTYLKTNQNITWQRPLKNGIKGAAQRVVRKLVRFLIIPIADDQSAYNRAVARSIELLAARSGKRGDCVSECEDRLQVLEERVSALLLEKSEWK